jgi:hypothetical protein
VMRRYTVAEIDRMRAALFQRWPNHAYVGTAAHARHVHDIECRLRTYMIAEIDPLELESEARMDEAKRESAKGYANVHKGT